MLIGYSNKADSPATIVAGSQESSLPVSNLQDVTVARLWRTDTSGVVTSTYLTIDAKASITARVVALLGTNLTSSATVRIRASDADSTAVTGDLLDTGTVSAGVDDNYQNIYYVLSADTAARYWRIDITDATLPSHIQAGRLFLSPAWIPTKSALYGWSGTFTDASRVSTSLGGQTFVDIQSRARELKFTLSFMDEDEMYGTAFEIDRLNGKNTDILVMMRTTGSYISEQSVFGLVTRITPVIHETIDVYKKQYTVKERL